VSAGRPSAEVREIHLVREHPPLRRGAAATGRGWPRGRLL